MRARYFARLLSFALLLCGLSSPARAWWDKEWTIRKKVTIDTGVAGSAIAEPIGASTVLLRLRDGNFQFAAAKEDGSDIRVVAEDDKTLLTYHLERYDALLNEGFLWIKVPEIKPGAKLTFWLYYGNHGEKAVTASDIKGTYDAQTSLVYHFGEKSGPPSDATGKSGLAENAGSAVTGSLIGGGMRVDGKTPIKIPGSDALAWGEGSPLTWTTWIKPTALAKNAVIFSRRDDGKFLVVGLNEGKPYLETASGRAESATGFEINTWVHLAAVADAGKITLFVNGEEASSVASPLPGLTTPLLLGGDTLPEAVGFAGEFDEMTLAKAARPAGTLQLAALTQGTLDKADKLITFSQEEDAEASWLDGGGTFAIIVKHTLEDEAAVGVIIILAFMAVMSWYVMYNKVNYLNGQASGNAKFMKAWAHIANDLTVLDHGSDQEKTKSLGGRLDKKALRSMRGSAVYRIYHIGVEEIRHRLAAEHSSMELSARSIQSIRASLDGGLVREKQKIDKLVVLLTICISGGPFIGLLGTVIGVMITFAAVAAAGEVNVNAIAPGIAAALLATVAGLAVAIPALFGYNYILSRAKDATADMHVFIDEFITRMAEFYSDAKPGGRGTTAGHSMIKALAPTPTPSR